MEESLCSELKSSYDKWAVLVCGARTIHTTPGGRMEGRDSRGRCRPDRAQIGEMATSDLLRLVFVSVRKSHLLRDIE